MPRGGGGGGFRGGGFSGGGFSGGFSGGGFRGSAGSFRTGAIRSSGRPFGRTGAIRTVSHTSSGPYRHNYYHPSRHYWGFYGNYYRPWYWRWWHYPRFWGYYYRPWYYSPAYIGGGLILLIVLPLIILPLLGVAMYFPFSGGVSSDGSVNYRSTETLGFNEYWYEYENMQSGHDITFMFSSTPGVISWAISDQSFDELPTTTRNGQFLESVSVAGNEGYEYILLFLRPGSSITYNFNSSAGINFFIADTQDMITWNNYGSPIFYRHLVGATSGSGILNINVAQDYYVVWYNDGVSAVSVDYDINYTETGVTDLTAADDYGIATDYVSDTFTATSDGDWYFIVYFDPMHSPEESQDVSFDVTFELGKEGNLSAWAGARGWLVFFGIVAAVLIVMGVFNRRKQKEFKTTPSDTPKAQSQNQTVVVNQQPTASQNCPRCGSPMKLSDAYCVSCGEKIEGRRVGTQTITSRQNICEFCGANLRPGAKFCTNCGSNIQ
jgi:hypothetical protein